MKCSLALFLGKQGVVESELVSDERILEKFEQTYRNRTDQVIINID